MKIINISMERKDRFSETDELGEIDLDQAFEDMRQSTGRLTLGVMENLWKPGEDVNQNNGMGGTRKMPKPTI